MTVEHAAHDIRLLRGGVDLFAALVSAMDAAQREVRLETYIFDFSGAGADVGNALVRAAQRGVAVHVVVGYVLVSGLARQGLTLLKKPLEAVLIQEVIIPPPPPTPPPPPPPKKLEPLPEPPKVQAAPPHLCRRRKHRP